jgi:hypothetical protein
MRHKKAVSMEALLYCEPGLGRCHLASGLSQSSEASEEGRGRTESIWKGKGWGKGTIMGCSKAE